MIDSHNAAEKTRAAWRQEMEKTAPAAEGESDGEVHGVEDEEDVDRKVQESRARREEKLAFCASNVDLLELSL
ncbi:unnamed protein product [Effrenium voratum]|nr:unnamed protein product [Effrenium voratum]